MNAALSTAYAMAGTVASHAADAVALLPIDTKWVRACRCRRNLRTRYTDWAIANRDRSRALLWMHAPSVGEGLQARPVLELLRHQQPGLQIAYTHYSPSAASLAADYRESGLVDFADYLPWDTRSEARAALAALAPDALVFVKLDVWPALVAEAATQRVRLGLVSATLRLRSGRRSPVAAAILRNAYACLDAVGAIDEDNAARLRGLGARDGAVTVTGDSRYDQVWARVAAGPGGGAESQVPTLAAHHRPTLVAGSTWPPDERVVLDGWLTARQQVPTLRLVLAPHEPTSAHLMAVDRWASAHGVAVTRLGAGVPIAKSADLILVDRVGVLGDLYAVADVAFVGGGFHSDGLHSVLEPAAFGVPVVFGPQYGESRDARRLLDAGGAVTVRELAGWVAAVTTWLDNDAMRRVAGAAARAMVERGLGAARRSAALVETLLSTARARTADGGVAEDAS